MSPQLSSKHTILASPQLISLSLPHSNPKPLSMADKKRRCHGSSVSDTNLPLKTPHLSPKSVPFQKRLKLDSTILESLKQLAFSVKTYLNYPPKNSLLSPKSHLLSLPHVVKSLIFHFRSSVQYEIKTLIFSLTKSILSENGFSFNVPSRASSNHLYIHLRSSGQSVKQITSIMSLIHQLCVKSIHVTMRDLFDTDVRLFQDQSQSDYILDDFPVYWGVVGLA